MITYAEALTILEEVGHSNPLGVEELPLLGSVGRFLAAPVDSREDVPSFNNSAMDGFAVSSSMTREASAAQPVRISVRGLVAAGDSGAFERAESFSGQYAVEIMTGAPLPPQYDAVVRIEDVILKRATDGSAEWIEISKPLTPAENARFAGSDFSRGQRVLPARIRVSPEHVLACAGLGTTKLSVRKLPRIVLISTGSELVPAEEPTLEPGMIRNSTGPFLISAFARMGMEVRSLGIVRDDPARYRRLIEQELQDGADLIVSTGAVSAGKYDFVADLLKEMGAKTYFHKAAIRPGKPVLFSEIGTGRGSCAFFGMPGNPISTAVGLRFFIDPYLRARLGLNRERFHQGRLMQACKKPQGLRCFYKAQVSLKETGFEIEALDQQASYVVSSLLRANAWVILPENDQAQAGQSVEFASIQSSFERGAFL